MVAVTTGYQEEIIGSFKAELINYFWAVLEDKGKQENYKYIEISIMILKCNVII